MPERTRTIVRSSALAQSTMASERQADGAIGYISNAVMLRGHSPQRGAHQTLMKTFAKLPISRGTTIASQLAGYKFWSWHPFGSLIVAEVGES